MLLNIRKEHFNRTAHQSGKEFKSLSELMLKDEGVDACDPTTLKGHVKNLEQIGKMR